MALNDKLRGIFSLSAASLALLQSTLHASGQQTENTLHDAPDGNAISKTDKLILEPPHQRELLRLYASHSSHSSHASHSSHVSGVGHSSHYSSTTYTPDTSTTPNPTSVPTNPPPAQPSPAMLPKGPVRVAETNAPAIPTNSPVPGNSASVSYLETLKKEAANGSADSQYVLALYYIHGEGGCETNVEKAKMLLELSATQGNEQAKRRLAQLKADQQD